MGAAGGPTYECHLCGAAATVSCGACGALFYCGEAHRGAHWRDGGHGGAECERMAADVAAAGALRATLPFPWAAAATEAIEAQRDTACAFLERAGVHGVGLWRRECACGTAGPFGTLPPRDRAPTRDELWALPPGHAPGDAAGSSDAGGDDDAPSQPHDWASYYTLRGLPLESLAAVCLDAALTLTHALAVAAVPLPRAGQLVVHLLGPRRELDAMHAFQEAAAFLPRACTLVVVMLGPDVPPALHGRWHDVSPRLRVLTSRAACYDAASAAALPPAALVFAPNAGVAAYPAQWRRTAAALAELGAPPLVLTDFTREAARSAALALRTCGLRTHGGDEDGVRVNPFRRPMSGAVPAAALPAYGNGFLVLMRAV